MKKFSEQKAKQAADCFLGPMLELLEWRREQFCGIRASSNNRLILGWCVYYDYRFAFSEDIKIYVDLFGQIRHSNIPEINDWILLKKADRIDAQRASVKVARDSLRKKGIRP